MQLISLTLYFFSLINTNSIYEKATNNEYKLADEINAFVAPNYYLMNEDYSACTYNEIDIDKDGTKEILAVVADTNTLHYEFYHKVYIFKIKNNKLQFWDSTSRFEGFDARTRITVDSKGIHYATGYSRGADYANFYYNKKIKQIELESLEYDGRKWYEKSINGRRYCCYSYNKKYNHLTRTLTMTRIDDLNEIYPYKKRTKSITKYKKSFKNKLSDFNGQFFDNDYEWALDEGEKLKKYFDY